MPIPEIPRVKAADARELAAIMREELGWLPEGGLMWNILVRAIALLNPPRPPHRPFAGTTEADAHLQGVGPIATNLSTPKE